MAARNQIPRQAKRGEVVEVRVLIQHPMETGFRHDDVGRLIKRNVINAFSCRYNGVEVFRADLSSGIAANPYLQFFPVAEARGNLEVTWIDGAGRREKIAGPAQAATRRRACAWSRRGTRAWTGRAESSSISRAASTGGAPSA